MFRSTRKLLFRASPLLIAYSTAHPSQRQHEYTSPVVSSQHDGIVVLHASPQCWTDSLQAVHASSQDDDAPPSSLGTIVCAAMSHDHKKALALELARCQMEDAGRPLFETHVTDCSRPMKSTTVLTTCLSQMTDAGLQVYMHSFTHVHQSCTRLTQERIVQASQVATEQLHTVLAHQLEMWVHQDEREREREEREREREERQRELETEREERQRERQREREVREENLRQEQEQKILQLTKTVAATAEKMKPLLGIESLIAMATDGITWFTSVIHFLFIMNAVWLLTLSKRHDATRRFMFRMTCAGVLLECIMHWMVLQGILADEDRVRGISTLRMWTYALVGSAYIVGLILSLFQTANKDAHVVLNEAMLQQLEIMQILNANAEKLRKDELEPEQQLRVVVETAVPRPLVANGHHSSVGNCTETTPTLVSLPPTTILDKEQSHALAYLEVLRILSAHTPQPHVMFPQEAVSSAPRLCKQQVVVDFRLNDDALNDNPPVENLRKRSKEVNDDDESDEEPERKRLKE